MNADKLIIGFWTGIKKFFDFIDFDTNATVTMKEARMAWDAQNGTVMIGMPGGNVTLQVGQEINFRAKNIENVTITDGSPVYVFSASGGVRNIKYAYASDYDISEKTIGLATENIAHNDFGYVTTFGMVNDVNTNSWNEGDTLWLSDTSGQLTNVKPTSNNLIRIGLVVYKHAINGKIFVNVVHEHQKFGDVTGGNYTEIEPIGTVRQNGTGRTWVDIDFPIIIRITGANNPIVATVLGNLTMPQWAENDFNVCEIQEIIHPYSEGTPIRWHIHIITAVSDTTDRYVNWEIESNWSNISPNSKSAWDVSNTIVTSGDFLIPANTPIRTNFVIPINTYAATDVKIGAHFKARLRRIASTGAAPSVNPFCEMLQQHVLCDTMGSRTVQAK